MQNSQLIQMEPETSTILDEAVSIATRDSEVDATLEHLQKQCSYSYVQSPVLPLNLSTQTNTTIK